MSFSRELKIDPQYAADCDSAFERLKEAKLDTEKNRKNLAKHAKYASGLETALSTLVEYKKQNLTTQEHFDLLIEYLDTQPRHNETYEIALGIVELSKGDLLSYKNLLIKNSAEASNLASSLVLLKKAGLLNSKNISDLLANIKNANGIQGVLDQLNGKNLLTQENFNDLLLKAKHSYNICMIGHALYSIKPKLTAEAVQINFNTLIEYAEYSEEIENKIETIQSGFNQQEFDKIIQNIQERQKVELKSSVQDKKMDPGVSAAIFELNKIPGLANSNNMALITKKKDKADQIALALPILQEAKLANQRSFERLIELPTNIIRNITLILSSLTTLGIVSQDKYDLLLDKYCKDSFLLSDIHISLSTLVDQKATLMLEESFQLILKYTEFNTSLASGLAILQKKNLIPEDKTLVPLLIRAGENAAGFASLVAFFHKKVVLTPDHIESLLENAENSHLIQSQWSVLSFNNLNNQDNFDRLLSCAQFIEEVQKESKEARRESNKLTQETFELIIATILTRNNAQIAEKTKDILTKLPSGLFYHGKVKLIEPQPADIITSYFPGK